jgi:hypothetical protein
MQHLGDRNRSTKATSAVPSWRFAGQTTYNSGTHITIKQSGIMTIYLIPNKSDTIYLS